MNLMTEKLSDLFRITVDENDIVYDLQPDIKNGHNPKLKNISPIDYWKLYLDEEIKFFCKENHIPFFIWKRFGGIEKRHKWQTNTYDFIIIFKNKRHIVSFAASYLNTINSSLSYHALTNFYFLG